MSSAAADEDKAKSKLKDKDKGKKIKSKRKIKIFENDDAFEDSYEEGRILNHDANRSKPTSKSIALNNLANSCNSYRKDDIDNDNILSVFERRNILNHDMNHDAINGNSDSNGRSNKNDNVIRNNLSVSNGMTIPSHLRPPVIVTVNDARSQHLSSDNWRTGGVESVSATGSSEDHELLELLSNMKSSPKWQHARQNQIDDFTFERSNGAGNGNGNSNVFRNTHVENERAPPSVERSNSTSTSKAEDHHSQPHPFSINRAVEGCGGGGAESVRGGGGKRVKVEGQSHSDSKATKKPADATTPTDLALRLVRLELARREDEAGSMRQRGRGCAQQDQNTIDFNPNDFKNRDVERERANATVPFDLLTFFKYLDAFTQR